MNEPWQTPEVKAYEAAYSPEAYRIRTNPDVLAVWAKIQKDGNAYLASFSLRKLP
jgi:hypothetical protein